MTDIINPFPYFAEAGTGGFIYVGTASLNAITNQIVVYRDAALTLPWAQPIRTIDGYPAYQGAKAGLYAAVDTVSLTVLDGNGSLVSSDLNASSGWVATADLASTATGKGSALVGFKQSGTGAVSRTVQDKARETISAKDFGATGNGTTNDAPAFQAAIDHLETLGGGRLHIPAGTYLLNSTVTVLSSGITLEGDGHQSTWIVNGQANAPAIKFGDGVSQYNRNGLSKMIFGQKSGVTAVAGNCGLYVHKCSNFALSDVQCFQFPAALYDGVIFETVTQSYMDTIGLQECLNRNLYMHNQTFDIYMVNGRCDAAAYGIEFRDTQGVQGTNWTAFGNSVNAYRFTTSGSADNNQFYFLTNFIGDTSGEHNWKIEQLSASILTNCWAATQLLPITGGNWDGFYLSGADVEDVQFNACIAVSNNRHGLNINQANRIQINGGIYGSNFKPTAFGGLGQRNGLAGAGNGLNIGASTDRISVTGGKFENNKDFGISIASGATKVEIQGGETRFNISGGAIQNNANGSAAECRIKNVAGYNPFGFITAPAVPASNTAITNLTGVDVTVYLAGGTLTGNVQIGGIGVLQATNTSYFLPAGGTIRLTYSSAPTWQWIGM